MIEIEKYHLLRDGGRVKSAGVPVDFVFEQGKIFQSSQGSDTAAEITKTFSGLRDNPPSEIRERFFPLDRGEIKAQTRRSPALYRPVLKTDQGAGKFLPFEIADTTLNFPFKVGVEEGYVIPEAYFQDQLQEKGLPEAVVSELEEVKKHFGHGDVNEAKLAFERLEIESEKSGIIFNRRASVGRNGLMFIHPAKAERPIRLASESMAGIENKVRKSIEELIEIAEAKKRFFAEKNHLPFRPMDELSVPLYFQSDVHLFPDGSFVVAEMQLPDVGLFLTSLPVNGSDVFEQVHKIMNPIKKKVLDGFEQAIQRVADKKGKIPIYLVTRSEVINNREDVLEIKELAEIKEELRQRGYNTRVISAFDVAKADEDSLMFIFNLDPLSEEFGLLTKSYLADTKRKLIMVPDPFLRMAEREVTGYQHIQMSDRQIGNLSALVKEIESPNDKKEKIYTQIMAVDYFLRQLGINEDVVHFCHSALPTPIPAYRYDIKSLQLAANIIREGNLKNVNVRSIPISPERAVLLDVDGGTLYSTFRFMFLRQG
ncbi:MAG: hypothetical protein ABH816_01935 [Candidatus Levyibacteriota bacterium]